MIDIQGTYRLVSRTLPDGSVLGPPDVMGVMNLADGYRNFNLMWKDAMGKAFSISHVSSFRLTGTEYRESCLYRMVNDEISGSGTSYDFSGTTGTSAVKAVNGRVEFDMPLYGEPHAVFDEGGMTANALDSSFVDRWEKVAA